MGGIFLLVIGTFSMVALLAPGGVGWFLYLFLVPFYAAFPTAMFPPYGGVIAAGAWLILFPIVRAFLNTPQGKEFRKRRGWVPSPGDGGRWRRAAAASRAAAPAEAGASRAAGAARAAAGPRAAGRVPGATRRGAGPHSPADPLALASPLATGAFPGRPARSPAQGSRLTSGFRHRIARRRRPLARWRVLHGSASLARLHCVEPSTGIARAPSSRMDQQAGRVSRGRGTALSP